MAYKDTVLEEAMDKLKRGRAAHQGDPEPHALTGHDRWREPPRPPYAPVYGARHDRSCILRGQASEGSLDSRRTYGVGPGLFQGRAPEMMLEWPGLRENPG